MSADKKKPGRKAAKRPRAKAAAAGKPAKKTPAKQATAKPASAKKPKRTGRKAKLDEIQKRRGTLYVCRSCVWSEAEREQDGKRQGLFLYEAIQALLESQDQPEKTAIRGVFCLNGCKFPCNVSYRSTGKFSLRYNRLTPDNAADVLAALQAYADSKDGDIGDADVPASMRGRLSVRTPPTPLPPK